MTLHLSPAANEFTIVCAGCGLVDDGVSAWALAGWDRLFCDGVWIFRCGDCQARNAGRLDDDGRKRPMSKRGVFAVYRPLRHMIAVFVEDGDQHSDCVLSVEEARQLHGVLGGALRLADNVLTPLRAVAP